MRLKSYFVLSLVRRSIVAAVQIWRGEYEKGVA